MALGKEEVREESRSLGQALSAEDELVTLNSTENIPCQYQDRKHSPEKPRDRDTERWLTGRE